MAILIALSTTSAARAERVTFCFLFCAVERDAVDSFGHVYRQVISTPEDSAAIKRLPRHLRERITTNEVLYRCQKDWKGRPICSGANPFPAPIR